MTQATKAPPTSAARKGNKLFDYNEAIRKSGGMGDLGLAGVTLVKGQMKPGQTLFGVVAGIPAQQLASQVVVQQLLGGSAMTGNIVAGAAGAGLHFWFRSSFTLGLGLAMAAPLVAQLTQYGVSWLANLLRPSTATLVSGAKPPMSGIQNQQRTVINATASMRKAA